MHGRYITELMMILALLFVPTALGAQEELSADVVVHRANGEVERDKLYKGEAVVRLEARGSSGRQAVNTVIIYDLKRRVGYSYSLDSAMKVYVESPALAVPLSMFLPQKDEPCALALAWVSKNLPEEAGRENVACQKIGAESLNGRRTEKWQASETSGGRTVTAGYVWVDSELHITIKWQFGEDIGQLENIHLGPQPASLFALPSGYRKMEMPSRAR